MNKDGNAVMYLSIGTGFLAFWRPITGTYGVYVQYIMNHHLVHSNIFYVIGDYVSLLLSLIGFIFIFIGARKLSNLTRQRTTMRAINLLGIIIIGIGVWYTHLITSNVASKPYHLSSGWSITTLVIPYIYMWMIGFLAIHHIYMYRIQIGGTVYRQSWKLLAIGMTWIIGASIVLQYITTLTEHAVNSSVDVMMILIAFLMVALTCGSVFIAFGARRLRKIEEV